MDLMFALPDQTMDEWKSTIDVITELDIQHISAYSLIIEEGTPFYENADRLNLPDDDAAAEMYLETQKMMRSKKFEQYEISNYAKQGYECKHNLGYWKGTPYIGFGLGASSFISNMRFTNDILIDEYITNVNEGQYKRIDEYDASADAYTEFVILGLRLNKGFSCRDFEERFDRDIFSIFEKELNMFLENGLLERRGDNIFIPDKHLLVSNRIMSEFCR